MGDGSATNVKLGGKRVSSLKEGGAGGRMRERDV